MRDCSHAIYTETLGTVCFIRRIVRYQMHSLTHETICLADCQMELVLCHCLAAGAISIRIDVLITSQSQVGCAECKITTIKSGEFLIPIHRNVSKCSTFSEEFFLLA